MAVPGPMPVATPETAPTDPCRIGGPGGGATGHRGAARPRPRLTLGTVTSPDPDPPTTGAQPHVHVRASDLSGCAHRLYKQTHTVAEVDWPEETPAVRRRRDGAADRRRAVAAVLAAETGQGWVDVSRADDRVAATMAAVAAGADRIWGATFAPIGRRAGGAELLIRDAEHGGYLPVIVVNHKVTDPGRGAVTSPTGRWAPAPDERRKVRSQPRDLLRLSHLTRMLQDLGFASPQLRGGAIGFDADCLVVHDLGGEDGPLETYDIRFAERLAVIDGQTATVPSRVAECANCPWWTDLGGLEGCQTVLGRARDVSLVVRGAQATMLRTDRITTIDRLAAWTGEAPEHWRGAGFDDAVLAARSWLADAPLARRTREVTIARADVEVDVDMESFQEDGAYLWGTLTSVDGIDRGYKSFVTWDPLPTADEARSFAEFWAWLDRLRRQTVDSGRTFAAYCYSEQAENKWLMASARRFSGLPGIPSQQQIEEFIASDHWVDVLKAVDTNFVTPRGRGLKVIARLAGFDWRDAEAGGEASMVWYREAVSGDGPEALAQRRRLLEYNEDDVQATRVLREWMSSPQVESVPLADELPRSPIT